MKAFILILIISTGFWFSACKTTPEPSTPMPPQPESRQKSETRPTPSSETQKTEQSSAQQQSEPRQKSGSETGDPTEQAPAKEAASSPAAPKDAEGAKPAQKRKSDGRRPEAPSAQTPPESVKSESEAPSAQASQKAARPQPQAPSTAESKLKKAREDLKVSEATEQRIAAKLEALKKSGNASAEDIRDYEIYHERVQAMVAENRKRVEELESAYRRHKSEDKTPQTTASSGSPGSEESIPETQTQDQVAELDRQLTASLSQFDAMLLKEMETIETKSAAKMRDLAQEAAEAAKRLKEKGIDLGTGESESSDDASQQEKTGEEQTAGQKRDSETETGDVDDTAASSDRPKGQGSGPKDNRGSRYSKEDDDIVARQLREAAENETDPELKEKLWKEYEDYKKNTQ